MQKNKRGFLFLCLAAALLLTACSGSGGNKKVISSAQSAAVTEAAASTGSPVPSAEPSPALSPIPSPTPEPDLSQDFDFEFLDGSTVLLKAYHGEAEDVALPAAFQDKPVSAIGDGAFKGNEAIRRVVIPEGITAIGRSAFESCGGLAEVILPESLLSIESSAFKDCAALRLIAFPASLSSIADSAFYGAGLIYAPLPAALTYIGGSAFGDCPLLRVALLPDQFIQYPPSIFPEGDVFGAGADSETAKYFAGRGYEYVDKQNIVLEDSFLLLTGDQPRLMAYVGKNAAVSVPAAIGGIPIEEIPDRLFANNAGIEEIILPETVSRLGQGVFEGCAGLKSAALPGVVAIGKDCFNACSALAEVSLPRVQTIGENGFKGCVSLTSITLPAQMAEIGKAAFSACEQLAQIELPENMTEIQESVFEKCAMLERITIPQGVSAIGKKAFMNCSRLLLVTLPSEIKSIGQQAFTGCAERLIFVLDRGTKTDASFFKDAARAYNPVAIFKNGLYSFGEDDATYERYLGYGEESAAIRPDYWGYAVTRLFSNVFADSDLLFVEIPASTQNADYAAFRKCKGLTVIAEEDSYIAKFCEKNRVNYQPGQDE